jgi:hypothetical protein
MKNQIALLKTLIQNNDAAALNVFNTATAEMLLSGDKGVKTQLMAGWWLRLQKEVAGMSSSIDLFQVIKLGYSLKTKLDRLSNEQEDVIAFAITDAVADETWRKESAVVFLEYTAGRIQLGTLIKTLVNSALIRLGDIEVLNPFMGDITHVLKLALPLLVTAVKATDILLEWSDKDEEMDEDEDEDEEIDEDEEMAFSPARRDIKTTKVIKLGSVGTKGSFI